MSQLIDNLNLIVSIKSDIKSAIENKGVDMTGVSFPDYASKIGEISGGGGVDPSGTLEISQNGVYDVYSYASASVNVPQSVTGYTEKDLTEGAIEIINLNNSASYVANKAFKGNTTIETVNLPYATSVGNEAFASCYGLNQLSLPMCSYIGVQAFYCCRPISQVDLPMCSYIGINAFNGCWEVSQVNLPVCNYIGNFAFMDCSYISQVNLPMCSFIGSLVFGYNNLLSIITIGYSSVCSLTASNAFSKTQITSSTGSIYVPASLVDSYKSATNWSYFSTQIFPIPE